MSPNRIRELEERLALLKVAFAANWFFQVAICPECSRTPEMEALSSALARLPDSPCVAKYREAEALAEVEREIEAARGQLTLAEER